MKRYIIITYLFFSCSKERTPVNYTIDASKDTSFVVSKSSPMAIRVEYDITGQLQDSSMLFISYYNSKGNANIRLDIPLSPGTIDVKDRKFDFYEDNALFTFKHLNNKKGKLTIKASL